MGEPPRLPAILLPWEKSVIYFVTMCVKDRRQVLANKSVFEAIKKTIAQLCRWRVLAGVIMADHHTGLYRLLKTAGFQSAIFQPASNERYEKRLARSRTIWIS